MERYAVVVGLVALPTVFLGFAAAEPSVPVAYCSSINTASTSANSSIFQSEGLCYDFCNDDSYALAILQYKQCWCSNYLPSSDDQVDTSECDTSCPGYPADYCGGDDLYGYLKLDAAVSGTSGGSSTAQSTSTSSTSSTIATATKVQTETETETETLSQVSVTTSSSSDPTTSSTSLTSEKSSRSSTSTTATSSTSTTTTSTTPKVTTTSEGNKKGGSPTTITAVHTVTSEGTVIIQTVTTVSTPVPESSNNGLSKGAIAGLVVGILAALAAFVLGAILFRRHKRRMQEQGGPLSGALAGAAHRRGSAAGIMSKTGTMSSSGYGLPMEEDGSYGSPGRRMSYKPMDPRLDPKQTVGLYRAASHDSFNTIRDDQDYSRRVHQPARVLRVTNADPNDV